jgi:hypothetical protein
MEQKTMARLGQNPCAASALIWSAISADDFAINVFETIEILEGWQSVHVNAFLLKEKDSSNKVEKEKVG